MLIVGVMLAVSVDVLSVTGKEENLGSDWLGIVDPWVAKVWIYFESECKKVDRLYKYPSCGPESLV